MKYRRILVKYNAYLKKKVIVSQVKNIKSYISLVKYNISEYLWLFRLLLMLTMLQNIQFKPQMLS